MTPVLQLHGANDAAEYAPASSLARLGENTQALFEELEQEIIDGFAQVNQGISAIADGGFRIARALTRMRETEAYRDQHYRSFDDYCTKRHHMTADTARAYTATLASLGEQEYRELLQSHSARIVVALGRLKGASPEEYARTLRCDADGVAPVDGLQASELEAQVEELERKLHDAYLDVTTEQRLGRTITSRLHSFEEINREVLADRDQQRLALTKVQGDLQRVQGEHRAIERANHQLQQELAAARAQPLAALPGPPAALPGARPALPGPVAPRLMDMIPADATRHEPVVEATVVVHEVVETYDPQMVADLLQVCAHTLQRYQVHIPTLPDTSMDQLADLVADVVRTGDPRVLIAILEAATPTLRAWQAEPARLDAAVARHLHGVLAPFMAAVIDLDLPGRTHGS